MTHRKLYTTVGVIAAVFLFTLPIPHTTSFRIAGMLLMALAVIATFRREAFHALPLRAPFLAWAALALVSLTYAVNPRYSLSEVKAEILYSFLVYFSFYVLSARGLLWRAGLWSVFASLVTLSLTNIFLWKTAGDVDHPHYFYNGVGAYTTYLVTVFPFIILTLVTAPVDAVIKWLLSIAALVFLVPAYLTANRMFWVALVTGTVVLSALLLVSSKMRLQKIGVLATLAISLSLSAVLFYSSLERRLPTQADAAQVLDKTIDIDPRPVLWRFVIDEIASHPERGVGFGILSFDYAYPQWEKKSGGILFHAHNVFLDAGIQMGVPGILVVLWLFTAVLHEYWRLYQSDERVVQWIAACGIAMVVAVITKNMTDEFFRRDLALLFWALVGLSLGHGRYLIDARRAPP